MKESVEQKIKTFFDQYKLRKYPKGQILILNGEESPFVYHLVTGKVKQYDVSYRGDEMILNVFKPPAFFPMSLALNKTTSNFIFAAETDIEVHQAPGDDVVTFLRQNPDVMLDLLSRVYTGVDGVLGRMSRLMSSNASERLVYELILECRRFGEMLDNGSCLIHITEKDLGSRAGLSRETVNREIQKLKTAGLVVIHPNDILVHDLAALEKKTT